MNGGCYFGLNSAPKGFLANLLFLLVKENDYVSIWDATKFWLVTYGLLIGV